MTGRRALLLVLLAVALGLFAALDLGRFFSLEQLKASQASLAALRAQDPGALALGFFAIYVVAAALSLPGAVVLTLAGGALFGLLWGTVLVSFASSIGATLAFLASRHLLRDWVRARFGARLADIDRGIARDGAFYLFSLRLIPVVPFFVINLLMGLTAMRARTFYGVSQLGMLAGTVVYVNAGTQLARLDSLAGIVSPPLLASFALLAAFPWVARTLVGAVRRRRVLARWAGRRPRRFDRNLIVIGAGAAGLVTAYVAAAARARVTLIEAHRMGGDCLNTGCVPSKALIASARLAHRMGQASRWGLADAVPSVDWRAVMRRVQAVIDTIAPHDSVERYTALGVEVLQGHARLLDPWTVEVRLHGDGDDGTATRRLSARAIVLATGARPWLPPVPGLAESGVLTSDTLWDYLTTLDAPPPRLTVLGGGPIGCELAQAMARLGSRVTLVEQAPRLLPREDEDVSAAVQDALAADGVTVLTGHRALRCQPRDGGGQRLTVADAADAERMLDGDALLCAVGRVARTEGFGLEALGIPAGRVIETNEYLQTLHPSIYVAGDAAGPLQFTHAAAHQAWHAAVNALFGDIWSLRVDHSRLPAVTFTEPEVARIGLNEREAAERGIACEVTRYGLDDLDRAIADGEAHGFVKVLTAPGRDRILGVTLVGAHAGELLAEWALAMRHGLGLNRVLATVHAYPTWAEASRYAAGAWKRAHAPQRLLQWLGRWHDWRRGD